MKGLSPLIAEVLLIAFVVAVGAIIAAWVTGFTKSTTKKVSEQSSTQVTCTYGSISFLGTPTCNNTLKEINGYVKNDGNIVLGDIKIQLLYKNGTFNVSQIKDSMSPGDIAYFNLTADCNNLQMIRVTTNCTSPEVADELTVSDINIVS